MAKLIALAAFLSVFLVIIANASASRMTTITTVKIEEESNQGGSSRSQRCQEQVQRQDLSQCRQYLTQSRSREMIKLPTINREGQQEQPLRQCCEQLRRVESQCQCEALESVVQEQLQRQGGQEQQRPEVYRRARDIESECRLPQCQIEEESNQGGSSRSQRCQEQVQRQDLSQCRQYLTQSRSREMIKLPTINREGQQEQPLRQCCEQLRRVESQCQCEALESVVQEQLQRQRGQEQQRPEVYRRARDIESECRLPQCQIEQLGF